MLNLFGQSLKFKPKKKFNLKFLNLKIMKLVNIILNSIFFSIGSSQKIQKKTTRKILIEFKNICEKNNIELIIICLENYNEIHNFLTKNSFNWTTSNINLNEKDENLKFKWQLLPWDNHPNEKANQIYFEKLREVISSPERPFKPKKIQDLKNIEDQEYIYPLW